MSSEIKADKWSPASGTSATIGDSGDTYTVPTGANFTVTDELKTNKISPASGTSFTLGDSGDTFTIPSGATLTNSGTATGFDGGLVPVKQSTGTSGADNIIVNGWVSDTYENYIMYYDVTPATNGADIRMTLYDSSGNLSGSQYDYIHSGADASGGAYQQMSAQGQSSFSIGNNVHNNADRIGLSGYMIWKHPRIASKRSTFITHFKMLDNTPVLKHFDGAMDYKDSQALTGFYLEANSGQLSNWRIRCYGIVNS